MSDKTVLITGATSGIGFATAQRFLQDDYSVLIVGRNTGRIEEAKAKLGRDKVYSYVADVGVLSDLDKLFHQVQADGFKIDSLVINAGVGDARPIEQIDEAHFDQVMNVNAKGGFFTLQRALPLFKEKATVVFISSIASNVSTPGFGTYGGSKGLIDSIMSTAAVELITKGIRVNAVSPGAITTEIHGKMGIPEDQMGAIKQLVADQTPIKRFGEASEIANIIRFLCSEESSYMVGANVVADGGRSLV